MANINQITIDGTTYDIEDSTARASTGVTDDIKVALLNCFQNVAWTTSSGQDYYDALYDALYAEATVESITATYTQSGTVYDTASLSDLTSDLVVTATWSDSTTSTVSSNNYTLSGDLDIGTSATGTSTITVSYNGATTTFTVTVTTSAIYHWDFTSSLTDSIGGVTATLANCSLASGTGITFDDSTDCITLGSVFGFDKTMEIDIADASASFGDVNGVLFWTDENISNGFGYHYSKTDANNRFGFYSSDVSHWAYASDYSKTSFDGSCTLKLIIDSSGIITVYKDDVDINLLYDSASPYFTTESNCTYITLGSPNSSYPCFYNAVITGCRIYDGVI